MKMLQKKNFEIKDDNNLNDYKYFNNKIIPLEEEKNNFVNHNNNTNREKNFNTEEFDFRESKSSTTIPTHKK
jgi:hypothetical protein